MSSQRSDWRERLHTNPSRMEQEIAIKLQDNGIHYQTQVERLVTTADFYFPLESDHCLCLSTAGSILEQLRWPRTKNYDHSYGREDTGSSNYATTATQTRKETNFTRES